MRQKVRSGILIVMFVLMPVTFYYFSPYLIIMGASEGVITGSFIVFASLFLSALFLGRAFCSWVCPLAGVQEYCIKSRPKRVNNRLNWIRYLIWVPWLGIIIYMAVRAGGYTRASFAYQTYYGISVKDVPVPCNLSFSSRPDIDPFLHNRQEGSLPLCMLDESIYGCRTKIK